jgi:hypothetical protein
MNPELATFFDTVLQEAASDSGTWSLSTYTTFRGRIADISPFEGKAILDSFFSLILDGATKPITRYKLSQLCSAVHTFRLPHCEEVFCEYAPSIREIVGKLDDGDPLSRPTAHLLTSLFAGAVVLPKPSQEHGRRLSHGAVRLCGRRLPRQAMSYTPQPNSGRATDE